MEQTKPSGGVEVVSGKSMILGFFSSIIAFCLWRTGCLPVRGKEKGFAIEDIGPSVAESPTLKLRIVNGTLLGGGSLGGGSLIVLTSLSSKLLSSFITDVSA
jgi:hypothetical protein